MRETSALFSFSRGGGGGGIFGHVMRFDQSCTSKNKCLIFSHDSVRLFVLMQNRLAQLALGVSKRCI